MGRHDGSHPACMGVWQPIIPDGTSKPNLFRRDSEQKPCRARRLRRAKD